jgi:L-ascorbate metabolism protein UlaG (beta-lactamase superfamily)
VLSTPRLEDEHHLHLRVPFNDERVDAICGLTKSPRPWGEIRELLEISNGTESMAASLFTREPPQAFPRYAGTRGRWRYFGHACILIETPQCSILSDPVISYVYDAAVHRYTYRDLPDHIDFVVITHNHQDHILFETLLQLRNKVGTIIVPRNGGGSLQDPSMRLALQHTGFRNVVALDEMETLEFPGGSITGLPFLGEHGDLDIRSKLAYLIKVGRRSLVLAADSCNVEPALYAHLRQDIGDDVDVLFLGMECDGAPFSWYYGPLMTTRVDRAMDQSRRLAGSNYEQAVNIVDRLGCKEVYVYAMGQEPWLNYVMSLKYTAESRPIIESNRLLDHCRDGNIVAQRLFGEKEMFLSD